MYNITELVVAIGEWSKALLVKVPKAPRFARLGLGTLKKDNRAKNCSIHAVRAA